MSEGKRGRPLGFKLSEASKRAISMSKRGQRHKLETREKISRSLMSYFRKKCPLSEELSCRYFHRYKYDAEPWLDEVREELDTSMDILTDKALRNKSKIEICCGFNIEYFSHSITPELIYLFKEFCDEKGIGFEEGMDIIGGL